MLRLFLMAVLAFIGIAATPAQALTMRLDATLSGESAVLDMTSGEYISTPIGPFTTMLTPTGSWEAGFSSYWVPCNETGCLKASFEGNDLWLRTAEGGLPCYCTETIRLTFDQPFTGDLSLFTTEHFVGGRYEFSEGTWMGGTYVTGEIFAAYVPEPAAWAMIIGGFALAGGALRRRAHPIALAAG